MKRLYAIAITLAFLAATLIATPAVASAAPNAWLGTRQQAINYVIARALSQRGVPYTYGGGSSAGPSLGIRPAPTPEAPPSATSPEADLSADAETGLDAEEDTEPATNEFDPATIGFDSSGLIQYAFAGVGIKLPRASGEQYKVGRKILPSQALPGDLIFFGPQGTQSVAMFLGNGQMIEGTVPAVTVSEVRTDTMTPYLTRIIDPQ